MSDLIIVGTDTDAGKTTFALLWLAAFGEQYEYWKPLESGASDSQEIRDRLPDVVVHPPFHSFKAAVAPPLAARQAGVSIPSARQIEEARPQPTMPDRRLLIETFGSPLSPLNETQLQVEFLKACKGHVVAVTSSAVGAIGRVLQCLAGLEAHGIEPSAVVLLGEQDQYAEEQIRRRRPELAVFSVRLPESRSFEDLKKRLDDLKAISGSLNTTRSSPSTRQEWLQRDREFLWHPYSPLRPADEPLLVVGADDEFLRLADGQCLIDGISSWWTILHGHRHPPLINAWRQAIAQIDHVHFAGVTHPWGIELAELLLQTAPWSGGGVFYSDNGSTAVEVGLKMAYQFWCHRGEPRRTRFIGFEHGYHGDTFGSMAVSRDPLFFGRFEPLLFQADIVPLDPQRLDKALAKRRGEVAAVIVEPLVQGAGGMRMHSPQTLRELSEVAARHDVLFIADEVMTGGGRTGTLWAYQVAGIAPDLICTAKTLAGGMLPLAATLVSPRVVAAFDTDDRGRTFFHGHSFTGHPVACAIGVANWRMLTSQPLIAPVRMQSFWRDRLQPLIDHAAVREVRIQGSIAAVDLAIDGGYLAEVGQKIRNEAVKAGVLLRPLGNVLYALPPFCTSDDSLDRIAGVIEAAVKAL